MLPKESHNHTGAGKVITEASSVKNLMTLFLKNDVEWKKCYRIFCPYFFILLFYIVFCFYFDILRALTCFCYIFYLHTIVKTHNLSMEF